MRKLVRQYRIGRRGFLKGAIVASAAAAAVPGVAMAQGDAARASFPNLGPHAGESLLRMARDIFPHDRLADRFYLAAIGPYDAVAAKDAGVKALLSDGIADLDRRAKARFGMAYADIPPDSDRVMLLKEVEHGPFFQKLRGDLVISLYNNKEVWPLLGYEGSSWEKGGYLHRGFDDIDWL